MRFTQYYLDCLSQASYLIGDETSGVAAIVDPRRDIDLYLDDAKVNGLEIRYVIETHFHADFLSGHLELADATGATIIYGAAANPTYPVRHVDDGERIALGDVVLEFRATPGHTPESISVVVYEHADDDVPYGVLTGDTLFIGDVGRPDLLTSVGVSGDQLARHLYRSLHDRLLTLPDATRVFPAHGAGSACGKNLSTETSSTIGEQRATNYALQPMAVDDFVVAVTEGLSTAPAYFAFNASLNKRDRELIDVDPPMPLTVECALDAQRRGAVVIDGRDAALFAAGHLRGSINVGLAGRYAEFAGSVLTPSDQLVLVTDPGDEAEAKTRLARIGFDNVIGYIADGIAAMADRAEILERGSRLTVAQFETTHRTDNALRVVDVRDPSEHALGAIPGSTSIPLAELVDRLDELDLEQPIVVYCAGGYRSSIAASILRRAGADDVSEIVGGYTAWVANQQ